MSDQNPVDATALFALAEHLLDPQFRTAFRQDPSEAMQTFDLPSLPEELIQHLAALTDQQLEFIANESEFFKQFPVTWGWV